MVKRRNVRFTEVFASIGVATCLLLWAGCESTTVAPDDTPTGNVTVVVQKEVTSAESGQISIVAERLEEIAERSTSDKGASSLMTAQKVVNAGSPFSSFHVGKDDQIVASLYNQEGKSGSDIWVFGSGKTRITKTNYFNNTPTFSADGKHIYFSSTRSMKTYGKFDQASYIWRMVSSGGGGITRIGTPVFAYVNVIESPNSMHVLFSSREFYENSNFVWYSAKNGNLPTQLTQGQDAKWMADDKIVFASKDENSGLFAIWTLKIDGTELTQIISDAELDCISPAASLSVQYSAAGSSSV